MQVVHNIDAVTAGAVDSDLTECIWIFLDESHRIQLKANKTFPERTQQTFSLRVGPTPLDRSMAAGSKKLLFYLC